MNSRIGRALHSIAYRYFLRKRLLKSNCAKGSYIRTPSWASEDGMNNLYMEDHCLIDNDNVLYLTGGKLIMKRYSGASVGFTVISGNHQRSIGMWVQQSQHIYNIEKDIVLGEDVWIAANVTLLSGVHIGRGATVGAGSVCLKNVPPYAIVMGNPAKIVGFNFTPEEIIEHESKLYPPEERMPLEVLQKNYQKYYLDRRKEIRDYLRIY